MLEPVSVRWRTSVFLAESRDITTFILMMVAKTERFCCYQEAKYAVLGRFSGIHNEKVL